MKIVEKVKFFLISLFLIPLIILVFVYVAPYIPEVFPGSVFLMFLLLVILVVLSFLSRLF